MDRVQISPAHRVKATTVQALYLLRSQPLVLLLGRPLP